MPRRASCSASSIYPYVEVQNRGHICSKEGKASCRSPHSGVASSTGLEEEPKDREQACSSSSHWSGRCLEQQAVDSRKADRRQQEGRPR